MGKNEPAPRDSIYDLIRIKIENELPPNPPPAYLYLCGNCKARFWNKTDLHHHTYFMVCYR